MAYDEHLAERVEAALERQGGAISEIKRMFGGLCFMIDGKMCIGIVQQQLMVRLDPEVAEKALQREGCEPMNFTGRTMKGFIFVNDSGYDLEDDLEYWVSLALEFNPRAKASSKKRKTKKDTGR